MRTIYVEKNLPRMLLVQTFGRLWPNIVWSQASPARVASLPTPELPGPRWVRVRNLQCGICASDLSLLYVRVDPAVAPAALPGNQRIYLGHEVVSVVEEAGPGVSRVQPGDRVVMDTCFIGPHCLSQERDPVCTQCARGHYGLCEYAADFDGARAIGGGWGDGYIAHESEVYPVPPELSIDQATMVEPLAVGVHAVLRRPPKPGDHVLVLGSGIIGLLTLQAIRAVAPGCRVTAVARYRHQAEAARRLGATDVITHADYETVARLTGSSFSKALLNKGMLVGGFDLVYDCVGTASTLEDSLRWTRAGGAVIMVGIEFAPLRLDHSPIWYQEVDLIGSLSHGTDEWQGQRRHTYAWVIDWLRAGTLTVEGLITHRFSFDRYQTAVATAQSKSEAQAIKVVLTYPD